MVSPAAQAKHLDPGKLLTENYYVGWEADMTDAQVEYVKITNDNVLTWPEEALLTKPLKLRPEAGRPGGVQPGDIVWLAKRKKIAEVGEDCVTR